MYLKNMQMGLKIVGIVFISSEDDFCELVYDELEDTKEFLVNSYNGELSFEVRI